VGKDAGMRGDDLSIQARIIGNFCFGCGADNPDGLHLQSHWHDGLATATFSASPVHAAGPRTVLNGGIIATLLDCHGICTALADAHDREARPIGSDPQLWYATSALAVEYLRPTPLAASLHLEARIATVDGVTTTVECLLDADGKRRARATVTAVRVPDSWRHGHR
jgi:acyl-coenzyme A thioesterase PaaI-like protein